MCENSYLGRWWWNLDQVARDSSLNSSSRENAAAFQQHFVQELDYVETHKCFSFQPKSQFYWVGLQIKKKGDGPYLTWDPIDKEKG